MWRWIKPGVYEENKKLKAENKKLKRYSEVYEQHRSDLVDVASDCYNHKDYHHAIMLYSYLLELEEKKQTKVQLLLKRGKAYKLSGNLGSHISDFETALELETTTSTWEGVFSLIESYIFKGQMGSAKQLVEKHVNKSLPTDEKTMLYFFRAVIGIIEDGNLEEHVANLRNWIENKPLSEWFKKFWDWEYFTGIINSTTFSEEKKKGIEKVVNYMRYGVVSK